MNRINNYHQVVNSNINNRSESHDNSFLQNSRKKNDSTVGQNAHNSITSADTCSFDGDHVEKPISKQHISRSQNPQIRRNNEIQQMNGISPYLQPQLMVEKESLSLPANNNFA